MRDQLTTVEGIVSSVKYNNYLTKTYGKNGLEGYTMHVLMDSATGIDFKEPSLLELYVYAREVFVSEGRISYINVLSPMFVSKTNKKLSNLEIAVAGFSDTATTVQIKGYGALKRKERNGRLYYEDYHNRKYPFYELKMAMISGGWLDELVANTKAIAPAGVVV